MRKMATLLSLLLTLSMVLSACGGKKPSDGAAAPQGSQGASQAKTDEPIKVGVVTSLTGIFAATGKQVEAAVKTAAKEWNDKGGVNGRKIEVVIEDDQSKPDGAAAAYKKVLTQKPIAVWGPSFTPLVMALGESIKSAKTPTFTSASAPAITKSGFEYVFRVRTDDIGSASALANYVTGELKPKRPAIIFANNDYGKGGHAILKAQLEKAGIQLVAAEQFNQGDKDVSAQLLKIKQANPDYILAYAVPPDSALVASQIKSVGLTAKVVTSSGFATPEVPRLAKDAVEGIVMQVDTLAGQDSKTAAWTEKVKAANNGVDVSFILTTNYDGAMIVFDILSKQPNVKDGAALRDALLKVKGYEGLSGRFNSDAEGNLFHQAIIGTWNKAQLVEIKKVAE